MIDARPDVPASPERRPSSGPARRRRRWLTGLVTLALLSSLAVSVQIALAATVVFPNFSDSSSLQLNGDAAIVNSGGQDVLRLTPALASQSGSAFLTAAVSLTADGSFSTSFSFQITGEAGGIGDGDGDGADGLVFVMQTVSNTAGGGGGGIGYDGLIDSVGIEFDTYDNAEINGNHIGIDLDGSVASVASVAVTPRLNDGNVWYAWVDYDGVTDTLEVRAAQVNVRPLLPTLSHTVDLPTVLGETDAFVGFTSGTGAGWGNHDIRSWTFIDLFNPVGLNEQPTANAGPDQTVTAVAGGTPVTLNGSGSTDPDGDELTYTWTGPFNGGTATGVMPSVTFATTGSHTVTLTVDDGNGGTHTDTVVITVQAAAAAPAPTPTPTPTASALPNTATADGGVAVAGLAAVLALLVLISAYALAFARRRAGPPAGGW